MYEHFPKNNIDNNMFLQKLRTKRHITPLVSIRALIRAPTGQVQNRLGDSQPHSNQVLAE